MGLMGRMDPMGLMGRTDLMGRMGRTDYARIQKNGQGSKPKAVFNCAVA